MSKGMNAPTAVVGRCGVMPVRRLLICALIAASAVSSFPAWAARQCEDGSTAGPGNVCPEDPDPVPTDGATFVSQSVPTSLQTGQTTTVTVQMRNSGTTTWTSASNYRLGSQNPLDNTTWGTHRAELSGPVAPGQTGTFTFTIQAPSTPGSYNFQWRVLREAVAWFGASSTNVTIQVAAPVSLVMGAIDGIDASTAVVGWACSTYRNDSIPVHLYVGGPAGSGTNVGAYTANLASEPAVASSCAASGTNYRFSIPLTTEIRQQHAGKAIYIHGISPVGTGNPTIAGSGVYTIPGLPAPPADPPATDPPPTSTATYSQTETITYYDNTSLWVLGQVAKRVVDGKTVEQTTYNSKAEPATIKSFGKLQQTLTYNADGTVATAKDGNNNVTTYSKWKRGIPQAIAYADGSTEGASVNDNGWITAVRSQANRRTCYAYDAMGRIAKVTYQSEATSNTCDTSSWNSTTQVFEPVSSAEYGLAAGHWRQTITTGDAKKQTYFDALWRPVVIREFDTASEAATKRFQRLAYDHEGRVTFAAYPGATDALTTGTWTDYDALGRVTSVSQDSELGLLTTVTEYLSDFKTRVTDPKGNQITTTYKAYAQPTYDWPMTIAHPGGAYTDITRDSFGKPLSIKRRNSDGSVALTRSYAYYSSSQELCRTVEPETGATLTGYDAAGNLKWSAAGLASGTACVTDGTSTAVAARRVDRTYDARNRLSTLTFPDGAGDQTWTYSADGLPAKVAVTNPKPSGEVVATSTTYSYNRRRLLVKEVTKISSTSFTLAHAYDANGHLSSQTYPTGLVVDYAPNALGQPTQAGSYATGVSYYPNGAIKQFTYGNGIIHKLTQNARQLPSRSTDCMVSGACATANKRLDLAYTFDENGNVAHITDGVNGRQNRGMAYDGLDRLTQVTSNMFGTASYGYDVLDNLAHVQLSGGQARDQYYCYDSKWRLTNVKTSSCTGTTVVGLGYDVQGNLANKNGQAYVFDYGNRLRSATGKAWYGYDGQGRRVLNCNTSPSACDYQQYAFDGKLYFHRDNRAAKYFYNVYLGNSLVAIRELPTATGATETVLYQHTDALGTPIAVTDVNKALAQTSEYEPYGQLLNRTLTDGVGFTGHVQDAATGLTYMQQRYYDPSIGVFLSVDPVTADEDPRSSFNRYRYANGNPYTLVDLDGREAGGISDRSGPPRDCAGEPCVTPPTPPTRDESAVMVIGQRPMSVPRPAVEPISVPWPILTKALGYASLLTLSGDTPLSRRCGGHPCDQIVFNELGEVKPNDAPAGTIGLDEAKRKFNWSKDKSHEIKDAATGGLGGGKTWVGVAPDKTVGTNNGGHWTPQGTVDELSP
jgi:RHS repeat-associated protein